MGGASHQVFPDMEKTHQKEHSLVSCIGDPCKNPGGEARRTAG